MNTITRKIGFTAAALTAAFALSACTSAPASTPEPTATQTVTAAPVNPAANAGYTAAEQTNIDYYEQEFGPIPASEEQALLDLGYTICDTLDAGATFEDISDSAMSAGMDPYEAGYITAGAIFDFCPVHEDYMNEWLNSGASA